MAADYLVTDVPGSQDVNVGRREVGVCDVRSREVNTAPGTRPPRTKPHVNDVSQYLGISDAIESGIESSSHDTPPTSTSSEILPLPDHTTVKTAVPAQLKNRERTVPNVSENITNYQAVGSFRYNGDVRGLSITSTDSISTSASWVEVTDPGEAFAHNSVLSDTAGRLVKACWIRLLAEPNVGRHPNWWTVRVYVLPDDVGRTQVDRSDKLLRRDLAKLLRHLDPSVSTWHADFDPEVPAEGLGAPSGERLSLFYLYNTLPSPSPSPTSVKDSSVRKAMYRLLDERRDTMKGLRTPLYPYQRRSAALILQREAASRRMLDPRLQKITAPDQSFYYFDRETGTCLRHRVEYEEPQGGVLAETMGLGKTLICLAVIAATKGHWPKIPVEHSVGLAPVRGSVGSLFEMCASAMGRLSTPWKAHLEDMERSHGFDYSTCKEALRRANGFYTVPIYSRRLRRVSSRSEGRRFFLSTGTIIVCPANLLQQWRNELNKHVEKGYLKVLVMSDKDKTLPDVQELLDYDIVLMTKPRFETEPLSGNEYQEIETSPMGQIHWKRIIVDEGHTAGTSTKTMFSIAANRLLVDCRWIVSGTPTTGLIGAEVGLVAFGAHNENQDMSLSASIEGVLNRRKVEEAIVQEQKDIEKLGNIATSFLKMRPWANSAHDDPAPWARYIPPRTSATGMINSYCLRSTMQSMIIKHRPEDVDVELPPLHNRVVQLEPSLQDKLSNNLFVAAITANAVTSEREDADYFFHPRNRKELNQLVNNLRQGAFFWTGFSVADVTAMADTSREYLAKEDANCSIDDRRLLGEVVAACDLALSDPRWRSFSNFHELGYAVAKFPETSREHWALDGSSGNPLLLGSTQLIAAQKHVNANSYALDPAIGLSEAGGKAMKAARKERKEQKVEPASLRKGVPTSTLRDEQVTSKKRKPSSAAAKTALVQNAVLANDEEQTAAATPVARSGLKSAMKISTAEMDGFTLPESSSLAKTRLVGVSSKKLAYLIDQILSFSKLEKTLIFYEGDDTAYYISQALDIIGVKHLIYSKTLTSTRRAQYVVTFNTTETFRVLLMEVHQASHGLNMSSASRVFFVNPIWQPNIEAQAIKRAHRIGQRREVFVETLVLQDTIEDKMLQRRRAMTHDEHEHAQNSLLDDQNMHTIIRDVIFLPVTMSDIASASNLAQLAEPLPVFGRVGRASTAVEDPDADLVAVAPESPLGQRSSGVARFAAESPRPSSAKSSAILFDKPRNRPAKKRQAARFATEDDETITSCHPKTDTAAAATQYPSRKRARFAADGPSPERSERLPRSPPAMTELASSLNNTASPEPVLSTPSPPPVNNLLRTPTPSLFGGASPHPSHSPFAPFSPPPPPKQTPR
ncbi:MAG: hypothetical protein M1833_006669 [Piccolia ochrophora]|nr:MAG: hypothetical protein M1833_006669 [Piccolia ochrophora]